jgi:fucose 4-O-acetylase-like acetyltransferase
MRIHGFDAWRVALLILGPVIHSAMMISHMSGGSLALDAIVRGIHVFRMETFFAIAGFFAATSSAMSTPTGLVRRLVQLAVPLAFGWVVIIPLSIWSHNMAMEGTFSWSPKVMLHLWFLLSLTLLSPAFWVADRQGWLDSLSLRAERHSRTFWYGLAAMWMISATALVRISDLLELKPLELASVLLHTPGYGFFYLAGFLVSRSPATRHALTHTTLWHLGVITWFASVLFWVCFREEIGAPGHPWIHFWNLALVYAAALGTTFAIFATALRVKTANRVAGLFQGAAYTIYIVHMIPVGMGAYVLSKAGLTGSALFAGTAAFAFATSFAFHQLLVQNSKLGALLINGKVTMNMLAASANTAAV